MTNHTPSWYPQENTPEPRPAEPNRLPAPIDSAPIHAGAINPDSINTVPMHTKPRPSRRKFLGFAAAGAATVGGGAFLLGGEDAIPSVSDATDALADVLPTPTTRPLIASEDVAGRTLVVIELQGGNDGLATLVPRNAGVLYDKRGDLHIPDEELIDFTDEYGWNPGLAAIAGHGMAALVGLGSTNADGSHFEMERRWWAGQSSGMNLPGTGFLGRLCDQLMVDQPVTGVALGGATPAMRCDKAVTVGLSDPQAGWFLQNEDPWFANLRQGMSGMSLESGSLEAGSGGTPIAHARSGLSDTLAFGETLQTIDMEGVEERYPNISLGRSLGTAAQLIKQDAGIRVVHVSHGGFDTHSDQRGTHENLMQELAESLDPFLREIADSGHAESTLVCTTSEFGRRVAANDAGTDHGAAGMAMLAGPVAPGVHGQAPSLTSLDDGNLIASVDFEQYYATIAEKWFGIPSSEVLDSGAAPLDGIIA